MKGLLLAGGLSLLSPQILATAAYAQPTITFLSQLDHWCMGQWLAVDPGLNTENDTAKSAFAND